MVIPVIQIEDYLFNRSGRRYLCLKTRYPIGAILDAGNGVKLKVVCSF